MKEGKEEIDLSGGDAVDVDTVKVDPREAERKQQEEQLRQLQAERAWMGGAWGKDEDHRMELDEVLAVLSCLWTGVFACIRWTVLCLFVAPSPLPYEVNYLF